VRDRAPFDPQQAGGRIQEETFYSGKHGMNRYGACTAVKRE